MIKKIEGIIISTVDYKESSKIVNIFTLDEGIIGVIAKGCKNIKSRISATSSVLTYGTFYLKFNKGNMPMLYEVDIIDSFKNIRKDLIKTNYSIFLLELISQVYRYDKTKKLYELLISGLKKINEGYDAQVITNIIELKLLEHLGIKPEIDCCVNCKSSENLITISSYKGGLLCEKCIANEGIVQLSTIKLIRMFYYIDISKITKIDINDEVKREIGTFIDDYYERYSGLYIKSKNLLTKLAKIET